MGSLAWLAELSLVWRAAAIGFLVMATFGAIVRSNMRQGIHNDGEIGLIFIGGFVVFFWAMVVGIVTEIF